MTRPFERSSITELEALAAKKSITEDELFALAEELSFRTTARAEKLLGPVLEALKFKQSITRVPAKVADRKETRLVQKQGSLDLGGLPTASATPQRPVPLAPILEKTVSKPAEVVPPPPPNLSAEQAYKLLKVPMLASLEQIEQSRRELVARAQPDRLASLTPDKRKALQDECRMVNAAYRVLLQTKN